MTELSLALFGIISLFILSLLVKKILRIGFCPLCQSVFLTWATGIILYYKGLTEAKTILALLIGGSSVGIYYFLQAKIENSNFKVFLFPLFLTLLTGGYFLLEKITFEPLLILAGVWIFFFVIYLARKEKFKTIFNSLLECCKRW